MLAIVRANFFSVLFLGFTFRISISDDTCVTEGFDLCTERGEKCITYMARKQTYVHACRLTRPDDFTQNVPYCDDRMSFDTKNIALKGESSTTGTYSVYFGNISEDITLQENCCDLTENSGGCNIPATTNGVYYVVYPYMEHTTGYLKYCYKDVEWNRMIWNGWNDAKNTPCLIFNNGWYEPRYKDRPTSPESHKMKLDACFFDLEQPHEITNDYNLIPNELTQMDADVIRTYSKNAMTVAKVKNKTYYCNPHTNIDGSISKTFIDEYAKNGSKLVCYSMKYPESEVYLERAICILFEEPGGHNFVIIGGSVCAIFALIALVAGVKFLPAYHKVQKSKGDVRLIDIYGSLGVQMENTGPTWLFGRKKFPTPALYYQFLKTTDQAGGESLHAEKTLKNESNTENCDVFIPGEIEKSAPGPVFVNCGEMAVKVGNNQDNLSDVMTPDVYIVNNPGSMEQIPGEGAITEELICDTNVQGEYCSKENATMMPGNPGLDSGMDDGYMKKHIYLTANGKHKGSESPDELDSSIGDTNLQSGYTSKHIMI